MIHLDAGPHHAYHRSRVQWYTIPESTIATTVRAFPPRPSSFNLYLDMRSNRVAIPSLSKVGIGVTECVPDHRSPSVDRYMYAILLRPVDSLALQD